jgi:hypothetical protein
MVDLKTALLYQVTDKMKIDLNVFHARVINRIETEIGCTEMSHSNWGQCGAGTSSSVRRVDSHTVSEAAVARARYSASVEDRATARCFLELHEIGLEPRKLI